MTSHLRPDGDVELRVAAPVAYLTFGSPSGHRFPRQIEQAGTRVPGTVRVVVVSGVWAVSGPTDSDDDSANDFADDFADDPAPGERQPLEWLERPDFVSVAVLHGPVTGPAFALALACDVRIATTGTTFALPELEKGRLPALGAVTRLVRALGYARAFELCVLGTELSAERAAQWGLVSSIVAASDLDAVVEGTVDALLALPRSATVEAKALLKAAATGSTDPSAELAAARRLARERAGYADG